MDVELARGVEEDHVVVRCDDAALGQALVDLYFSRDGDRYVKRFPAGSFTDGMLDRFREALVPLLRQTARLDPVPWREALRDAIRRLDGAGIDWWLAGSAALGARGLQVEPRDIDLVISEADVSRAADAFEDVLIEPAVETDGWIARWFGRAWLGARVEWVAGVSRAVDEPVPSDFGPAAAAALTQIEWEQTIIRVPPIELQYEVSARRGLADRVALIQALKGTRRPSDGGVLDAKAP
jgi:hypothetical protein